MSDITGDLPPGTERSEPVNVDVYVNTVAEGPNKARWLGTYKLGVEMTVPLPYATATAIELRAVPRGPLGQTFVGDPKEVDAVVVTVPGLGGGGGGTPEGGHIIADNTTVYPARLYLAFVGATQVVDDAFNNRTLVYGVTKIISSDASGDVADQPRLYFKGIGVSVSNDAANQRTKVEIKGTAFSTNTGTGATEDTEFKLMDVFRVDRGIGGPSEFRLINGNANDDTLKWSTSGNKWTVGAPSSRIHIYDESTALPDRANLSFLGPMVQALDDGPNNRTVVHIISKIISDDILGDAPDRPRLYFKGVGVVVTDDAANDRTKVEIKGTTLSTQPATSTAESTEFKLMDVFRVDRPVPATGYVEVRLANGINNNDTLKWNQAQNKWTVGPPSATTVNGTPNRFAMYQPGAGVIGDGPVLDNGADLEFMARSLMLSFGKSANIRYSTGNVAGLLGLITDDLVIIGPYNSKGGGGDSSGIKTLIRVGTLDNGTGNGRGSLLLDGVEGAASLNALLEMRPSFSSTVAPAGRGRLRYNGAGNQFEVSVNAGAWKAFMFDYPVSISGGPQSDTKALNFIPGSNIQIAGNRNIITGRYDLTISSTGASAAVPEPILQSVSINSPNTAQSTLSISADVNLQGGLNLFEAYFGPNTAPANMKFAITRTGSVITNGGYMGSRQFLQPQTAGVTYTASEDWGLVLCDTFYQPFTIQLPATAWRALDLTFVFLRRTDQGSANAVQILPPAGSQIRPAGALPAVSSISLTASVSVLHLKADDISNVWWVV